MSQNILSDIQVKNLKQHFENEFIFLSISGAHLYGFKSFNSDLDIRGVHLPQLSEILRYFNTTDTLEKSFIDNKIWPEEIDLVSHSLIKFLYLLTKKPNGYILEQIFSPLIIHSTPLHKKLQELAKLTITKELHYHYNGFFQNQTKLLTNQKKEIKLCLYQIRIICTAVFLARTGKINANLSECNNHIQLFDQDKLQELINLKKSGEKNNLPTENLKKYWLDQIQDKESLITIELLNSQLPNFDPKQTRQKIDDFLNHFVKLKYCK